MAVVEEVVPGLRLEDSSSPMPPSDGLEQRLLPGCVGPFGDGARHVGARRARAVHAVGAEGAEQRPVEQRPPAQVELPGGAGREGGHGEHPDVLGFHDAAVLLVAAQHLRLQPERAARPLGVPPRLAAGGGARQVGAEPVLPRLEAAAARHPGQPVDLDLARREPVVAAVRRHVGDGAADAVRSDQAVPVDGANGVDAPLHLPAVVVALEGEPVEVLRIGRDLVGRLNVVPVGVGIAVPGLGQRLEVAVLLPQPAPEISLHPLRVVDLGRVVDLVPDVVAEQPRMALVAGGKRRQEGAGRLLHLGAVEGERPRAAAIGGKAAGRAGDAHVRGERPPVGAICRAWANLRMAQSGTAWINSATTVLMRCVAPRGRVPVVVLPVVDLRPPLDRSPHEPVAEDVEPVLGRDPVVAFPVLARRVGLAEIDRAERHLRQLVGGHGCSLEGQRHPHLPRGPSLRGMAYADRETA